MNEKKINFQNHLIRTPIRVAHVGYSSKYIIIDFKNSKLIRSAINMYFFEKNMKSESNI